MEIITGLNFIEWLEENGVIKKNRPIKRVIIDASFDSAVTIYYEELGTADLIKSKVPDILLDAKLVNLSK